ncbi:lytic transglycosylase domain-containing protein [Kineococcus terrestris]|uniref:lytic transglycosylase domain-containing protein n=1 Tax=Kineococcus terrestris TaxID=2044856 RepID=UPI0034DB0902
MTAVLTGAVVLCAPADASPTAGSSGSSGSARTAAQARAEAARARDAAREATARVEDVRAALERQRQAVTDAVSAGIRAEVAASRAAAEADEAAGAATRRVRSLYMAGGAPVTRSRAWTALRSLAEGGDPVAAVRGRDLAVQAAGRRGLREQRAAEQVAVTGGTAADEADADALAAVAGLRDVAEESVRMADALARAQQQVAALDEEAGRLQAAEDAARELERARAAAAELAARASAGAAAVHARPAPADWGALYAAGAATCPGMRTALLTAVGQVESGHGRNNGPSSAGAQGPMQFMPATFAAYGVDGDGDGVVDVWSPADAVRSAANYLCANGGGQGREGERRALYRYNRAGWYVDMVQRLADELDATSAAAGSTG